MVIAGDARGTHYPLTRPLSIGVIAQSDLLSIQDLSGWSTSDPDERIKVVLDISLNEYVALANCVDIGRDIAYGDNSDYLWWLWCRVLDSMSICDAVLDCINNRTDIQAAIAQYANGAAVGLTDTIPPEIAADNVLTENVGCDLDSMFGFATGIVDLINNLAIDIIEILVAGTNTIGRLGDMIEAIPVIGELPVDDALQFVESFAEDVKNNYDAAYTQVLRDTYRCDLFCIGRLDCELTMQELFDYFAERLVVGITTVDLQDFLEYFVNGTFAGTELVDAFHTFVAGVILFGGKVLNVDFDRLQHMVSALYNDPDPDWDTLCSCAFDWEQTFDFSLGAYANDWYIVDEGTYIANKYYQATTLDEGGGFESTFVHIRTDKSVPQLIEAEITYHLTPGQFEDPAYVAVNLGEFSTPLDIIWYSFASAVKNADHTYVWSGNEDFSGGIRAYVRNHQYKPFSVGTSQIKKIVLRGKGANPFDGTP